MKLRNPFLIYGYVSPEYFCDREVETEKIISALRNGRNVTLMSPRRMGKTGLIHNVFFQINKTLPNAACFYLDLFPTKDLSNFVSMFGKAVMGQASTLSQKAFEGISSFFRNCNLVFSPDPISGTPQVSLDFKPQQAESTLQEIFEYLKSVEKECFIAFDEFQQVTEYPETTLEATLRSYAQFCPNVHFIFSGSKQHLMSEIFDSPQRPFYRSTQKVSIAAIPEQNYYLFGAEWLSKVSTMLPQEIFHQLYERFEGHTWYLQNILNHLYEQHPARVSIGVINDCIAEIVLSESDDYKRHYNLLTNNQKQLLRAIGVEKCVQSINGGDFMSRYRFKGTSSVNKALAYLLDKEYVYRSDTGYIVYDRFMGLWLQQLPE